MLCRWLHEEKELGVQRKTQVFFGDAEVSAHPAFIALCSASVHAQYLAHLV